MSLVYTVHIIHTHTPPLTHTLHPSHTHTLHPSHTHTLHPSHTHTPLLTHSHSTPHTHIVSEDSKSSDEEFPISDNEDDDGLVTTAAVDHYESLVSLCPSSLFLASFFSFHTHTLTHTHTLSSYSTFTHSFPLLPLLILHVYVS